MRNSLSSLIHSFTPLSIISISGMPVYYLPGTDLSTKNTIRSETRTVLSKMVATDHIHGHCKLDSG